MARVLIVDDYPGGAESLAELLRGAGHEALGFTDASEAIDVLPGFRPDLVISDLFMPGLSGFDLARTIRAVSSWQDIFLVAMTSYDNHFKRTATAAGFDRYFTKPLLPEEIGALIDEAVAPRQGAGPGTRH